MKYLLSLSLIVLMLTSADAQIWTKANEQNIKLNNSQERSLIPDHYSTFQLDIKKLKKKLKEAPQEYASSKSNSDYTIDIPMPDGTVKAFNVFHSSVMRSEIQAKYSDIRNYKAYAADGSGDNMRFTVSPLGFHGSIRTKDGSIYIDPYAQGVTDYCISYYTKDDHSTTVNSSLSCGHDVVNDEPSQIWESIVESENQGITLRSPSEKAILREYDFAIGCTGNWGQGQTVESIMAKFNIGVARLNQIFENEVGLRIIIINNNDQLIYLDPDTDPYSDRQGFVILPENTAIINNVVGSSAYDIGHVWSNCDDIGGVAFGSSVCTSNKGAGVTCIGTGSNPSVSSVMVNITAHEIGHQLSAGHSWNRCTPGIEDQYAPGSAFEPGSGSTIMSYAGACINNDVQGFNEDVYGVGTLSEIRFYTTENVADACATKTTTNNNTPEASINLVDGFTIPISTPFELTGDAYDPDGDVMTYSWEQFDLGPSSELGSPQGNAPLFRTYYPNSELTRVFPRLSRLVVGANDITERLPTITRDLTFRFVVRDNNPELGGVDWATVKFKSTANAGPFVITYPSVDAQLVIGQTINVTWNVANTDQSPVNCQEVNIYLSEDGGYTYPHILAQNVSNDGEQEVIIPNAITNLARIKVKAANNIFFDIGNLNSRISAPQDTTFYMALDVLRTSTCLPNPVNINIETLGFNSFADSIQLDVLSGLPNQAIASFDPNKIAPGETTALDIDMSNVAGDGIYNIIVRGIAGEDTLYREFVLETTGNDFSNLLTMTPEANQTAIQGLPTFSWNAVTDADSYTLQVSSSPDFSNNIIDEAGLINNEFLSNVLLEKSTVYYWRVIAVNPCGNSMATETSAFATEALQCSTLIANDLPKNISQSGLPTVESQIFYTGSGQISDINIPHFKGVHDNVKDLVVSLIHPDGTQVKLLDRNCNNSSNFNCGFDDDSPFNIQCPMTFGNDFIPIEPLSALNGKNVEGLYTLKIEDKSSGSGGQLTEFELEICSNVVLDQPFLVNNIELGLPPNSRQLVHPDYLLTQDNNNTSDELIYTIVQLPSHGTLALNNSIMALGAQFSQQDIDQNKVIYAHDGGASTEDAFLFTVIDGQGGWIGITQFDLLIDDSFVSSTLDADDTELLSIFPNPADDHIMIHVEKSIGTYNIQIIDITGKVISYETNINDVNKKLNTKNLVDGTYFLIISNEKNSYQKQIVVAH